MYTLSIIGLATILIMLALIMTKKISTMSALILVPMAGYLIASFLGIVVEDVTLGSLMVDGIRSIAPTGVMFIFAILFFGILLDAGTFDPIIDRIIKLVGGDPVKIAIGAALLAAFIHLDGSGAVTFVIVIPAMLPLFDAVGMRRSVLATVVALAAGVMNMLPWGGPTLRAITALDSSVGELYIPMIPGQIAGVLTVLLIAGYLGVKERNRLGYVTNETGTGKNSLTGSGNINITDNVEELSPEARKEKEFEDSLKRPHLFWVNILLILIAIAAMISEILPPAPVFMIGTALALIINFPDIKLQSKIIDKHAPSALMMASMLFAAGSFTGILTGSGMLGAMSEALVAIIPNTLGRFIHLIVGVFAMPLSLVFDPDSFYYGVLPVLSSAAEAFGVSGISVGQAAIAGQMSLGFPISPLTGATFLLIGLTEIDLGDHQKSTFGWAWLVSIVVIVVSVIFGAIPL